MTAECPVKEDSLKKWVGVGGATVVVSAVSPERLDENSGVGSEKVGQEVVRSQGDSGEAVTSAEFVPSSFEVGSPLAVKDTSAESAPRPPLVPGTAPAAPRTSLTSSGSRSLPAVNASDVARHVGQGMLPGSLSLSAKSMPPSLTPLQARDTPPVIFQFKKARHSVEAPQSPAFWALHRSVQAHEQAPLELSKNSEPVQKKFPFSGVQPPEKNEEQELKAGMLDGGDAHLPKPETAEERRVAEDVAAVLGMNVSPRSTKSKRGHLQVPKGPKGAGKGPPRQSAFLAELRARIGPLLSLSEESGGEIVEQIETAQAARQQQEESEEGGTDSEESDRKLSPSVHLPLPRGHGHPRSSSDRREKYGKAFPWDPKLKDQREEAPVSNWTGFHPPLSAPLQPAMHDDLASDFSALNESRPCLKRGLEEEGERGERGADKNDEMIFVVGSETCAGQRQRGSGREEGNGEKVVHPLRPSLLAAVEVIDRGCKARRVEAVAQHDTGDDSGSRAGEKSDTVMQMSGKREVRPIGGGFLPEPVIAGGTVWTTPAPPHVSWTARPSRSATVSSESISEPGNGGRSQIQRAGQVLGGIEAVTVAVPRIEVAMNGQPDVEEVSGSPQHPGPMSSQEMAVRPSGVEKQPGGDEGGEKQREAKPAGVEERGSEARAGVWSTPVPPVTRSKSQLESAADVPTVLTTDPVGEGNESGRQLQPQVVRPSPEDSRTVWSQDERTGDGMHVLGNEEIREKVVEVRHEGAVQDGRWDNAAIVAENSRGYDRKEKWREQRRGEERSREKRTGQKRREEERNIAERGRGEKRGMGSWSEERVGGGLGKTQEGTVRHSTNVSAEAKSDGGEVPTAQSPVEDELQTRSMPPLMRTPGSDEKHGGVQQGVESEGVATTKKRVSVGKNETTMSEIGVVLGHLEAALQKLGRFSMSSAQLSHPVSMNVPHTVARAVQVGGGSVSSEPGPALSESLPSFRQPTVSLSPGIRSGMPPASSVSHLPSPQEEDLAYAWRAAGLERPVSPLPTPIARHGGGGNLGVRHPTLFERAVGVDPIMFDSPVTPSVLRSTVDHSGVSRHTSFTAAHSPPERESHLLFDSFVGLSEGATSLHSPSLRVENALHHPGPLDIDPVEHDVARFLLQRAPHWEGGAQLDACAQRLSIVGSSGLRELRALRVAMTQCREALVTQMSRASVVSGLNEGLVRRAAERAVEKYVMVPLLPQIVEIVCTHSALRDQRLRAYMEMVRGNTQAFFGVQGNFQSTSNWSAAIATLSRIDASSLPCDKLNTVSACLHAVFREVALRCKICLGADDLLPILTYVVTNATMEAPEFTVEFIMQLCDPDALRGEEGYHLMMLQASLNVICKCFEP